eukprot:3029730-Heterocapsa_arctica.AAC.1
MAKFVRDGINRARQLAREKAAKIIPNYDGVEKGVDDFLAQKRPLNAGALHTIITDGVWYPQRANNISTKQ